MTTAHPFDAAAITYDADFTHQQLALWLRQMVWDTLPFEPGDHILDCGCGTGEDALHLLQSGCEVTALDASAGMLTATQAKIQAAGYEMTSVQMDLNEPANLNTKFDGVLSNFGVLNCVENRPAFAEWLAQVVRPGSDVILVVMSPTCPWEIIWHLAHGKFKDAFRRLQKDVQAHTGDGNYIRVWYPTLGELKTEFAPYFRTIRTMGIGTLLPPSYLSHLVEQFPTAFKKAYAIDTRIKRFFPFTYLNDHYLIHMQRTEEV